MDGGDFAGSGNGFTTKAEPLAIDVDQETDGTVCVAGGVQYLDGEAAPYKGLVRGEARSCGHVLTRGVASAAQVVVDIDVPGFPGGFGIFKEVGFVVGHGDFCAPFNGLVITLAQVAVVVGV